MQKQIDNLKLSHNIHLVGKKTKGEIVQILSDSSVFILPSRSENFSVSILEGLAVGLPVIATLCGGVKECINEKNGLLVPVENVPALADAMKKCMIHWVNMIVRKLLKIVIIDFHLL